MRTLSLWLSFRRVQQCAQHHKQMTTLGTSTLPGSTHLVQLLSGGRRWWDMASAPLLFTKTGALTKAISWLEEPLITTESMIQINREDGASESWESQNMVLTLLWAALWLILSKKLPLPGRKIMDHILIICISMINPQLERSGWLAQQSQSIQPFLLSICGYLKSNLIHLIIRHNSQVSILN